MRFQLGMFQDVTRPKGFLYLPEFISREEETHLLQGIKEMPWQDVRMHGVIAKRKVMHFGLDYEYSTRALKPTVPPPDLFTFLIKRAAKTLKIKDQELAEILVTHYPVGAPIGWHRDAPLFESLIGVSLGSSCIMKFRQIGFEKQVHQEILENRSAYIIQGDARWKWQHHIPAAKEERYSITFRTLVQNASL
jgi:alkylated DNA repair protein (DNA oxidative demethylase)